MTSISASALLSLLPLLAILSLATGPLSAHAAHAGKRSVEKVARQNAQQPLSFQAVGDAGISAQMVCRIPFFLLMRLGVCTGRNVYKLT